MPPENPPSPTTEQARSRRWPAWLRASLGFLACGLVAAIVALPVVVENAVENVHFEDDLGTFPVEVSLSHDGRSTLDTGLFGKVYLQRTGALGFGARLRATGPPVAGGTLASYVNQQFISANVSLINDPGDVIAAYSREFRSRLLGEVLVRELLAGVVGGLVLFVLLPRKRLRTVSGGATALAAVIVGGAALGLSTGAAAVAFHTWPGATAGAPGYTVDGVDKLSFSSPETREVAAQVTPFIAKNTKRIDSRAREYRSTAEETFARSLAAHTQVLKPRSGETIVLAEADTQGSDVGTEVRTHLYRQLFDALGEDSVSLRTISGDVTSNGTVAESGYVHDEALASGDVPSAAVGGDHDSRRTWDQMSREGITVPDLETKTVGGLRVAGANDREHKTLFGGMVTNPSGTTERQLGTRLRDAVGDQDEQDPRIVLLHQPEAVAGYLGLADIDKVKEVEGSFTAPYDDGVPDQPPGILSYGHLHQAEGPWVLWNTGGKQVTWTLVDQLGTAGGVENAPTFSRFSTPFSVPLKPIMVRLQYVEKDTGLATGFATVTCSVDGDCSVTDRTDVGLSGGRPVDASTP